MEFFERVLLSIYFFVHTVDAECKDSNFRCGFWASRQECEINPGSLVPICAYSCHNPCECPVFTADTACDCLLRAKSGECESNPTLLNVICKTTCNIRLTTNCSVLPAPVDANARLSTTDTSYLTVVDEVCNPGWEPVDFSKKGRKLCGKDGEWFADYFHDRRVECQRVDCGDPPDISQGTKVCTSTLYESTVMYTCDIGYRRAAGDLLRTCNESAMWSGSLPVCQVITCPGPPVVAFASRTGDSNVYDSTIEYVCNTGHNHSDGDLKRRCQLNGEWSGTRPVCDILHCPEPVIVPHASLSFSGTHYQSRSTYMCLIGYNYTSGDLTRECQADQTWSGEEPICTIISCGEPPLIAGAKTNASGLNYSDTVVYECYIQEDEENFVRWSKLCEADGQWKGEEGWCKAIRKKFEATPVEASGSVAFGTVAMSILIVILLCIIILDIPTVVNQSRYLRKNIKNFRKGFKSRMQNLLYHQRWARGRVSLDDIRDVSKVDGESMNLSTVSIQTAVDRDDDGLRMQSAGSRTSRAISSCQTSMTSLAVGEDTMATLETTEIMDEEIDHTPIEPSPDSDDNNLDQLNMLVEADVEIHNLD